MVVVVGGMWNGGGNSLCSGLSNRCVVGCVFVL